MTLDNFYKSREWETFRALLMQERTNENGEIICAICGKPITKKYDCIGHHKIPLTDENVNDFTVSLNPDNVDLIHFRCHNKEHDRDYSFTTKHVYLVYGSPCSGKTTWVNDNALHDDLIVDIDRLWDAVCNDGRYNKTNGNSGRPHRLKANVFGVRDCLFDQIRIRKGMWRNAFIIGGYPLRTERDRICDLLRAEPIFIEATKEECLKRAENERPEQWKGYIEAWFAAYVP